MLNITTEYKDGIFYVRLKGELTKDNINKLYQKVSYIIKEVGIRNVVFNLEKITKIDIKGINSLLYNYELCKINQGYSLILSNASIDRMLRKRHIFHYMTEINSEIMASEIIKVR